MSATKVSSVFKSIQKNPNKSNTSKEPRNSKQKLLNLVDKAIETFSDNLQKGKVKLNTSADLERLVGLYLMLSGELQFTEVKTQEPKMGSVLNVEDPKVKAVFEQYFSQYNQKNDVD